MKLNKALSLLTLTAFSASVIGCGTATTNVLNPAFDNSNVDLASSKMAQEVSALASKGLKSGDAIPGEFIVKYKKGAKNAGASLKAAGADEIHNLKVPGMQLVKVDTTKKNASSVFDSIKKDPSVEWVEANRLITVPKFIKDIWNKLTGRTDAFPNDPYFNDQYAHKVSDSVKGWELAKANAKKESVIAIIDTGIDGTHPDLKAKLLDGYDAYGGGAEYKDKQGHGTHCAGIASAITNNGVGVAGYSPDSKLISVKVLTDSGSGTYAAVADGIAWAAKSKADVLSMSLGGPSSSKAIEEAVQLALSNDKIVIAAMGNDGNERPSYPAAIKGVMAVGATDDKDNRASFSQYGAHISVSAPGVKIMSTFPTYSSGMPGTNYGKISGTSMSTPGVAGLAGLLKSINPSLKHDQLRKIIEDTSDDLGGQGWDKMYGAGRVNTFKAVQAVVGNSASRR